MPIDRYTKSVLTVIAAALVALAAQNTLRAAIAQQRPMTCTVAAPCYVTNAGIAPLAVVDARAQPAPDGRFRNLPPNSGQPR